MNLPSLLVFLSVLPFQNSGQKSLPATIAHKGFNTAFQPFRGVRMPPVPPEGHTSPHNRRHVALRFWAVVPDAVRWSLAENGPTKNCCLFSDFLNFLGASACRRGCLYDYGMVNFSWALYGKSYFSEAFLLLRNIPFSIFIQPRQ